MLYITITTTGTETAKSFDDFFRKVQPRSFIACWNNSQSPRLLAKKVVPFFKPTDGGRKIDLSFSKEAKPGLDVESSLHFLRYCYEQGGEWFSRTFGSRYQINLLKIFDEELKESVWMSIQAMGENIFLETHPYCEDSANSPISYIYADAA